MRIKKAILTGGGRATRLHPITTTINKHLLPVANKPMIFHAIEKAVEAGITEIFINTNPGEAELQKHIGDGGHWGVAIKFFEQTGGPQGIAHVVKVAQDYIGEDPFMFYLSDNILAGSLNSLFEEFHNNKHDCMLAFSKVENPSGFGVPVFDDTGKLIDILEKPANPPSDLAQTGIYLYGPNVFFEAFDRIKKSARGEYEISDIHSFLLKEGKDVGHKEITGYWKDTGQAESLLSANRLLLDNLEEKVQVGLSSRIGDSVNIRGPVIIGENCVLKNCSIGPYVTIGQGSEIYQARIENSIVLGNATIDCDIDISDSLIGRGVRVVHRRGDREQGRRMILGDKTILEV
jgi:glucose-1-phosphate thymidylyltransferase